MLKELEIKRSSALVIKDGKFMCFEISFFIMLYFLWSGSDMRTNGAKVAWDQVCLPKKEGGLGIKRITEWNKIALLKHIWNLCNDSDGSIW